MHRRLRSCMLAGLLAGCWLAAAQAPERPAGRAAPAATATPAATPAPTAIAHIDPAATPTPLPRLWRPSVMVSWPEADALQALFALPGRFGLLRYTVEPLLQAHAREADFFNALDREAPQLARWAERDAQIAVTLTRMPAWLASTRSTRRDPAYGYTEREAKPPASQAEWRGFTQRVAARLAQEAPGRLWYEGWNEPDAPGFWKGTRAELFDTWASFADGVRAGDAQARIGTPCMGSWSTDQPGGGPPLLQALLAQAARRQPHPVPLDFVCWHNFGRAPGDEWWGAASLREWAQAAGLKPDLPQLVTEWNLWSQQGQGEREPARDGARGAAFLATALHAMERAGVTMQTPAVLQDFTASGGDNPFHGDLGLMTRQPTVPKAAFQVLAMQARLLPQRLPMRWADAQQAEAEGLNLLATRDTVGALVLLISRYHGDARGGFVRSLHRQGYPSGRGLSIYGPKLEAFIQGREELQEGEVAASQARALRAARSVARAQQQAAAPALTVQLALDGAAPPRGWRWQLTLVDSRHLNAQAVFDEARRAGRSAAQAVAAAQALRFEPLRSGTGELPTLTLEPHAVALLEAQPL
ncbi:hypothetical protein MW290_21720 [Aquincola tertiaricarbonis]|uniref:Beta-xylosidase n=1 Tax=Aquincola tertiaricarbonis TaxID=391953 RepID=A0ABY4SGC9_AQUTE|nr:hypothetical protein [Aquincola tertiaricarbonis]URI11559.1 hypothetical protein MW290_21720 [Aquincola tertiaricarbonis]